MEKICVNTKVNDFGISRRPSSKNIYDLANLNRGFLNTVDLLKRIKSGENILSFPQVIEKLTSLSFKELPAEVQAAWEHQVRTSSLILAPKLCEPLAETLVDRQSPDFGANMPKAIQGKSERYWVHLNKNNFELASIYGKTLLELDPNALNSLPGNLISNLDFPDEVVRLMTVRISVVSVDYNVAVAPNEALMAFSAGRLAKVA